MHQGSGLFRDSVCIFLLLYSSRKVNHTCSQFILLLSPIATKHNLLGSVGDGLVKVFNDQLFDCLTPSTLLLQTLCLHNAPIDSCFNIPWPTELWTWDFWPEPYLKNNGWAALLVVRLPQFNHYSKSLFNCIFPKSFQVRWDQQEWICWTC